MSHVTQQHFEVAGGCLKVLLTTDHALGPRELERFDVVASACHAYAQRHPPAALPPRDQPHRVREHYDVEGGTLSVQLTTDHALSEAESRALSVVASACERYLDTHPPRTPVTDFDDVLAAYGDRYP